MSSGLTRLARALVLLAAVLLPGGRALAQPVPAQSALAALAAPLYRELATIKGVTSPGAPPPILVKSRADTRRFIEQELDRRYSAARLESERKGMVAWGLIPADYDLRRLFVDLMEEQVAAYYDPRAKVMVVGDWLPAEQQQAALAHELVHALQDRQMALDAFIAPHPGQGDQTLARQALVEGEAMALMLELALKSQGTDLASLTDLRAVRRAAEASSAGPTIDAAPRFLRKLLLFPYVDGLEFVYQFHKRESWSAMPALYRDPPRSTTQIMRPAKRLGAREDPVAVTLPALDGVAGGLKVVAEDELGEFALRAVLALHLGEPAGRAAAAGWRGDRYRVWEDAEGTLALAYLLAMENEHAAGSLALAYAQVMEKRHPALTGARGSSGSLTVWSAGGRVSAIEQRGRLVLLLEQVPARIADRVRDGIWRSRSAQPGP